ncbi:SpaA isopeptide-forming pilin-related protein [Lactococcus lactis]|uniref:MSCRAMM family protein n=1 Tax=Lactococcus lactis TaxID=1358 RepID=UPI002418A241|nr:SpaA isopeptide-forming pilin-related protein [Lactococcus lactis]MDG4966880.1 SpaA isopeptide-forming pilin-related protein [Lactococcus lactis]
MKKNIHIFSIIVLLFTFVFAPITGIAQTESVPNQSSSQIKSSLGNDVEEQIQSSEPKKVEVSSENIAQANEDNKNNVTSLNEAQPRAPSVRATGDDPGVTITSPDNITSSQLVELDVTLAGSAGMLNTDGTIQVTIPKETVRNPSDLTNRLVIGDPFYLDNPAVTTDSDGNYILNVKYDHTKIDQASAFGATFKIFFQAPLYYDTDPTVPDSVDFTTNLTQNGTEVSKDSSTSAVVPAHTNLSPLSKWSTQPSKEVQGVKAAIMDDKAPNRNIFAISVNYSQRTVKDAKIIDTTPEGTELADPNKYIPATGDATIYNHFRIAKVTSRDASGTPNGWEYVTQEFSDKINITSTGFTISLGDLTPDDSYVIMYAEKIDGPITPDEFGVRYNHVDLYSGETQITSRDAALALNSDSYQALSLKKSVSQSTLSTTNSFLEYTLELKGLSDVIKKGTIITDPLPENTEYIETIDKDGEFISDANLDSSTNTVSYTVLKDIPMQTVQAIKFKVKYSNLNAKSGDEIVNRASISYAGSNIYSNTAVTTLNGSAYLYKIDGSSNPLAGAEFKIIDIDGRTIRDGLISDGNGFINSGLLDPGKYQFVEVKAPVGYELDSTPLDFEVVDGQETPVNLSKVNKILVPGDVILTKVDAITNKTLEGAEFKLQDALGNDIKTNLISDASGEIIVQGLNPGQYKFIETKAPDGYVLDSASISFNIHNDQTEAVRVTAKNKKISHDVILTKVDSKTRKTLEGAVFELQDKSGKSLRKDLKTDRSGKIYIKGLSSDNYQFVETKAPSGYQLDSTPVKFTISNESAKQVQVTKTNDKISDKSGNGTDSHDKNSNDSQKLLPLTGDKKTIVLSLTGIFILLLCTFGLSIKKSFKK